MRSRLLAFVFVAILFAAAGQAAFAHHSWSGYDMDHTVALQGIVTRFDWSNPHVWVTLQVVDENGNTEKWSAGGPSPSRMANTGWSQNSLKPGDTITAIGHRQENGGYSLRLVKVILPDGRELICYGGR